MKKGIFAVIILFIIGFFCYEQIHTSKKVVDKEEKNKHEQVKAKSEKETKQVKEEVSATEEKKIVATKPEEVECMGIVDYVDFVTFNGITYDGLSEQKEPIKRNKLGKKLGKIEYMLDGHCYKTDPVGNVAAYQEVGSDVYAIKGYPSTFRIVVNHRIYEVSENRQAKTIGELYPIKGQIESMNIGSEPVDEKTIYFTKKATKQFEKEFLALPYVGFEKVFKKIEHAYPIFLQIHLKDGTSTGIAYYIDQNVFNPGANGTDSIKKLIQEQNKRYWELKAKQ